jgi:hypothetical protein
MTPQRIFTTLPYVLILIAAAFFYHVAGQIDYSARPHELGPNVWPRAALALMIVICAAQIGRIMLTSQAAEKPQAKASVAADEGGEEDAPRSLPLLAAGVALTVAYGFLINIFGFPLTTFVYMVLFMYLGGYRAHVWLWSSSFVGVLFLTVLFQSFVYVSLPRGIPPFDAITDFLVRHLG